ncbi:MAG: class I adenylate-forming enzyme family protein [Planctomycetaceae bacterium]
MDSTAALDRSLVQPAPPVSCRTGSGPAASRRQAQHANSAQTLLLVRVCHSAAGRHHVRQREHATSLSPAPNCLQQHLGTAFLQAARFRPRHPAVITPGGDCSFAQLESAAIAVRNQLLDHTSFRPGDRITLLLDNSAEYVAAFYGVLLAGGVAVPLPPDVEQHRLQYVTGLCESAIVLTSPDVAQRRPDLRCMAAQHVCPRPPQATAPIETPVLARGNDELAAILFTSGSTGDPKGVMLTHRNLLSNAWSICEYLGIDAGDRALAVLPFYHAFGNSILQTHILSGATLVLDAALTFPKSIGEAIEAHRATSFSAVPWVYQNLLRHSGIGQVRFSSLRYMSVAGGALPPAQAAEVVRRISPARFFVMYGQTEATARLSYLPPEQLSRRPGSVGKGLDGVTLEVVDTTGRPVEPGRCGEIRARGPNVMQGYWRDPAGTAQMLRDGWLYTGDRATVDADGYIYPQGRANALVKLQGHRVHPAEVERVITERYPALQAVVVPFDLPEGTTRLALFVQRQASDSAVGPAELRQCCREQLSRHKIPSYVEILDEFPRTGAFKLDRIQLARRAAERMALADVACPPVPATSDIAALSERSPS